MRRKTRLGFQERVQLKWLLGFGRRILVAGGSSAAEGSNRNGIKPGDSPHDFGALVLAELGVSGRSAG